MVNFIPTIISFFAIFTGISDYLFASYFHLWFLSLLFYSPYVFLKARNNQYIEKRRNLILFLPSLFYAALTMLYCYLLDKYNYSYPLKFSMFVPAILLNLAYNFIAKTIIERKIEQQNEINN